MFALPGGTATLKHSRNLIGEDLSQSVKPWMHSLWLAYN